MSYFLSIDFFEKMFGDIKHLEDSVSTYKMLAWFRVSSLNSFLFALVNYFFRFLEYIEKQG